MALGDNESQSNLHHNTYAKNQSQGITGLGANSLQCSSCQANVLQCENWVLKCLCQMRGCRSIPSWNKIKPKKAFEKEHSCMEECLAICSDLLVCWRKGQPGAWAASVAGAGVGVVRHPGNHADRHLWRIQHVFWTADQYTLAPFEIYLTSYGT